MVKPVEIMGTSQQDGYTYVKTHYKKRCKLCDTIFYTTNNKQVFHDMLCEKYYNEIKRDINNNFGIGVLIRIIHNNYVNNLNYTLFDNSQYFYKLLDYGFLKQSDFDSKRYKLSSLFYESFDIDERLPIG